MRELRPRVARPAGTPCNLAKTWFQTACMWAVFLFALPVVIRAVETVWTGPTRMPGGDVLRALGAGIFVLGGALGIWTGVLFAVHGRGTPLPFDTARELVVHGPYRHIRNPMAVASFAQGFGVALWLGSVAVALYVVAGMVVWQCVARPWEEADLLRRFGARYAHYRDAVPCWCPRWIPYSPPTVGAAAGDATSDAPSPA